MRQTACGDARGGFHLFVSYLPGAASTHRNWGGHCYILHYTSADLEHWAYLQRVPLAPPAK